MKPAAFKYVDVADETELAAALAESGDEARVLAGGQSLVPMMNFRIVSPTVLIDINRVGTLSYIDVGRSTLKIGALTRHAMLEDSPAVAQRCPLLAKAVRHVAHRAVRNRGTTGGSLALAYPGAEIPLVCMTLAADIYLRSKRGERSMPADMFLTGALDTALQADEYISGVEIALPPVHSVASFVETSRRHGDFAIAAAAAVVGRDAAGGISYIRAGVSGGTGAPIRLTALEGHLAKLTPTEAMLHNAAHEAVADLEVFGDHHYPEDYRRHLLYAALYRALGEASGIETKARHVH
jgi:CO/xanthine dehydrogenase FAD-binding subunit